MASPQKSEALTGQSGRGSISNDRATPSLLPSAFSNERPQDPGAEGYEGERLHEMFLSAQKERRTNAALGTGDAALNSSDLDQNFEQTDEPPIFEPFFTVIGDSATGAQFHPYVHYVFSDDDPDLMTNAILNALEPRSQDPENILDQKYGSHPIATGKERCIIVDVDHKGESIVSARSLAPDWQVLGHSIATAPTFGEGSNRQDAGLMLRIEGREGPDAEVGEEDLQSSKDATSEELRQSMDRLANQFHEELDALKKLASSDFDLGLLEPDEET